MLLRAYLFVLKLVFILNPLARIVFVPVLRSPEKREKDAVSASQTRKCLIL